MGEYLLDIPAIAIQMVGADVVSGIQWLQSFGAMVIHFQGIFREILLGTWKENELRGIQGIPSKVMLSNSMKKLLKGGHRGVIVRLCPLDVQTSRPSAPVDLQKVIDNNSKVFGEMPKGIPRARNHGHAIHLQPGSVPPNIRPCRYPHAQRGEINPMVQGMLESASFNLAEVLSLHE